MGDILMFRIKDQLFTQPTKTRKVDNHMLGQWVDFPETQIIDTYTFEN